MIHPDKKFWLVFLASAFLIFWNLDATVLQVDEGGDTFVSTTILKSGTPRHSDGINSTMEFANIFDGLFLYRTWVPYYLQATSLKLFGQNTFSARFPFALAGLLSVAGLYILTLQLTQSKDTAFWASCLLAFSVPALLYFRTARYIALPILLTIVLLHFYWKIFDEKPWRPWPFIVTAVIYFHTMYVEFAAIISGVTIHYLIYKKQADAESLKKVGLSASVITLCTLPWLIFIWPVFETVSQFYRDSGAHIDTTALGILKHLAAFLFQTNSYVFPLVLAPLFLSARFRPMNRAMHLLLICTACFFLAGSLHQIPLYQYIAGAIPLLYGLLAILLTQFLENRPWLLKTVGITLITTNLIHIAPGLALKPVVHWNKGLFSHPAYLRGVYGTFMRETQPHSWITRHVKELIHPYQGPLDKVVEYFKTHGRRGETCYIDNEMEAFAFYSPMRFIQRDELSSSPPPDWLILRGSFALADRGKPENETAVKIQNLLERHDYERFTLDSPPRRHNNSYDIQLHRFESPSESGHITIYRLKASPKGH